MLQQERFDIISEILQKNSAVRVTELSDLLHVSESTIRRDISDLEKAGRLKKVFGGAVAVSEDPSVSEKKPVPRSSINTDKKTLIARLAASKIERGDFVYIDAGSTTGMMLEHPPKDGVSYVTNGVDHAIKMADRGLRVFTISGLLKGRTESLVGVDAVESIKKYNFSRSFMGTTGIDIKQGFTTHDIEEARVKAEAIERSGVTYILADSSKFGVVSSVSFAPVSSGHIITDRLPDEELRKYTEIEEV